ncbi:MAG: hypothetical protein KatS3mg102_1761 [Planctomycetota bacterium]|nr:MAG: hypothetical protein KatS3mg102_1761 [Planctomycetota bacterium]
MGGISLRLQAAVVVALLAANLVALNLLVRPANARLDLTEERIYTITDATRAVLAALPDQITIYGWFSGETHPKLAPLVPRIRDLVEEYRVAANGRVQVQFSDPRGDEEAEKEAYRRFGVKPVPLQIQTKYEAAVKSTYFHLTVAYGDQHHTLGLRDLIEVEYLPDGEVEVRLANLEYELTRAIQKVVRSFGTLETRLAGLEQPVVLRVLLTDPARVPAGEQTEDLRAFLVRRKEVLEGVVQELRRRFTAGFTASIEDPAADPALAARARRQLGVRPIAVRLEGLPEVWCAAVLEHGGQAGVIDVRGRGTGEDDSFAIRQAVEAGIRRLLPGALRRLGIVSEGPQLSPEERLRMQMMGQSPPGDNFQTLREALRGRFEVSDVSLAEGRPPLDVDVLLVLAPKEMTEKERFALDQYLMLGGRAIVCHEAAELAATQPRLRMRPLETGLGELLAAYGIKTEKALLEDDRNMPFLLPVIVRRGGEHILAIEEVAYPWFVEAREDGINRDNPAVARFDQVTFLWPTPLDLDLEKATAEGARADWLLRSSERAWTTADLIDVHLELQGYGDKGYAVPADARQRLLAVAISGRMRSAYRDRPVPALAASEGEQAAGADHGDGSGGPGGANGEPAAAEHGPGHGSPEAAAPAAGEPPPADEGPPEASPVTSTPSAAAPDTVTPSAASPSSVSPSAALQEPVLVSTDATRLIVFGDADWLSDLAAGALARSGRDYRNHVALLESLIDWAMEDLALLEIRGRGGRARPLEALDRAAMRRIEILNHAGPALLVLLFGLGRWGARRRAERRRGTGGRSSGPAGGGAGSESAPAAPGREATTAEGAA